MGDFSKGGRGKRAPYETEHYRIPTPIKPIVQTIAESYRSNAKVDPTGEDLKNKIQSAIVGNNRRLEQTLAKLARSNEQLAEAEAKIARSNEQLAEAEAKIARGNECLAEAEAKIARGNECLAEMSEENERLNRQMEKDKKTPKG